MKGGCLTRLTLGTRLGPYEVVALLGAGGKAMSLVSVAILGP